jgi:hypothetical protein
VEGTVGRLQDCLHPEVAAGQTLCKPYLDLNPRPPSLPAILSAFGHVHHGHAHMMEHGDDVWTGTGVFSWLSPF